MYRKRVKTAGLGGSNSQLSTCSSSSSGLIPTVRRRSPSPKDMFVEETESNQLVESSPPSKKRKPGPLSRSPFSKTTKSPLSQSREDNTSGCRDLLDDLMSPPKVRTKGQRVSRKKPGSYMEEAIDKAGITLGVDGSPNVLRVDKAVFVRDLNRELSGERKESAKRMDAFLEGMVEYFADLERLKTALSPTSTDADCVFSHDQDCLIRLFLSVDCLQVKLIELLSEKISELISENSRLREDVVGLVRMILAPMRYLNFMSEPETVTKTLMDIVHLSANSSVAQEIISCLPDIISDDQHTMVADDFISLMKTEPSLTPSVLVALENLCLESEALYHIQVNLIKSLRKAPIEQVPVYVRLIITGACPSHIDELINGLRSELAVCLPASSLTQGKFSGEELSTVQSLAFDKLKDAVLKSRKLADAWLKNIMKVKNASKHKPIDFVMLLILHCTTTDQVKKKAVETAFRTKIRAGEFNENLVKDTFSTLPGIVKQYFEVLLKVNALLLQSSDIVVAKYATAVYEHCFDQLDNNRCKILLMDLLDQIRMWSNNSKAILSVLHLLTTKHCSKVLPHVTRIFLLLDSVVEFSVVEVRLLMDIICTIAFSESDSNMLDMSGFQDEIYMIVQKQLSCPDVGVFRCGIICAIMAIKHMATVSEELPNETPLESEEDTLLLTDKAKRAYKLLEMIMVGTRSSAEAQVLAFDQLSHVVMSSENLDKIFLRKVSLFMQNNLQNYYIIARSAFKKKNDGLEASFQYCIDDDIDDPIVLNLTDAIVRDEGATVNHIPCVALPSLLRVIRSLELADMTEIDALLGCSVTMPDPAVINTFGMQDVHIQKMVLDCLFHACNWFREIVNSFVYQIKDGSPEKILMRMRAMTHLQATISTCLPLAVSYSPPTYYYSATPSKGTSITDKLKKVGSRKKAKKRSNNVDENEEGVAALTAGPSGVLAEDAAVDSDLEDAIEDAAVPTVTVETAELRHHLRELDFDVCLVLTQPLELSPKPFKNGLFSAEFGPSELLLVVEDMYAKLKFVLGARRAFPGSGKGGANTGGAGFDNLATVRVELIVRNFSKLSQHLMNHLQKLVEYSHDLIKRHDDVWDAPGMFGPGTAEVKKCFSLILDCYNVYFSWSGLKCEANEKLLWKAISYLSATGKGKPSSLSEVLGPCLTYLTTISKCVLDLSSAVSLVSLITTLISLGHDMLETVDTDVGSICDSFLRRQWYDARGGELKANASVNQQVSCLVDSHLQTSGELCLPRVAAILGWLVHEAQEMGNKSASVTYPLFNKSNLNVLIRSLCKGLALMLKNATELRDCREQLKVWDEAMTCCQDLVTVIKAQDTKLNLRVFLKGSLPILRLFLSQGMSVCSVMFKMESQVVPQLLKKLQVVTRYIQTVCNYSKVSKDSLIIQQLPVVRGLLENILLSVKNMVVRNKCTDAFFMGSMKNKDLKGEVIHSQEDEEEEESEEMTSHAAEVTEVASTSDDDSDNESMDAVSDIC